jgi:DNA modification methylase
MSVLQAAYDYPASQDEVESIDDYVNQLHAGEAAEIMSRWPTGSVDLVVTSPPYWTAVEYEGQTADWPTYEAYLDDMMKVWTQCARVLRPNGKLCINAPIMPIPKDVIEQHTRHLKNIASDNEARILRETDLERYGLFIWQKQTSKMMFGSYPYPGNILENNTIEFINVYVKPGKPPKFSGGAKEANRLSRSEWMDLAQQVWFMYPEDVKREEGHPAPFPEKLPARLMKLYSYGAAGDFSGEIVVDPFVGTGTTCLVAKKMKRRWIGIDINPGYLRFAERRVADARPGDPLLLVGRPKYPTKDDLIRMMFEEAGSAGAEAVSKHKRKTYGRSVSAPSEDDQPKLV